MKATTEQITEALAAIGPVESSVSRPNRYNFDSPDVDREMHKWSLFKNDNGNIRVAFFGAWPDEMPDESDIPSIVERVSAEFRVHRVGLPYTTFTPWGHESW